MSDYYPPVETVFPLFDQKAPSVAGSATSSAAAASLPPKTLNAMQRRVLNLLRSVPEGLTDEEMQRQLGMNPSTQRPRRIELARLGMVVEAGTRKTTSGRKASVWRLA